MAANSPQGNAAMPIENPKVLLQAHRMRCASRRWQPSEQIVDVAVLVSVFGAL
jgi:hypothetical protein